MVRSRTHYVTLGVTPRATPEEIKQAYRRLALEHHPDRNPRDPSAHARFVEVAEAYTVLSDPRRRKEYDSLLARQGAPTWDSARARPAGGPGRATPPPSQPQPPPGPPPSGDDADAAVAWLHRRFPGTDERLLWAMWLYARATGEPLPGSDPAAEHVFDRMLPKHPAGALVAKLMTRALRWARQRAAAPPPERE
jgi:curved DNA-binding protein CbpA